MKKIAKLTESELVELIKRIIQESSEDEFDIEDENAEEDEIQDFGFDYEEDNDENEFEKPKWRKKFKPQPYQAPRSEWKKEWETAFSPLKPTDMSLDKYLANKKKID